MTLPTIVCKFSGTCKPTDKCEKCLWLKYAKLIDLNEYDRTHPPKELTGLCNC